MNEQLGRMVDYRPPKELIQAAQAARLKAWKFHRHATKTGEAEQAKFWRERYEAATQELKKWGEV